MIIKSLKKLINPATLRVTVLGLLVFSGTALAEIENPEVPEIPAGSAPFLLLGLLGSVFWIRNSFSKK